MKYYTDGFQALGNPSPVGGGYTITDEDGKLLHREVIRKVGFTNNEAEILGILKAMEIATFGDTISTDSMICLTWVNKGKTKARPDLTDILAECKKLKSQKKLNFMWEGRDFNKAGWLNDARECNEDFDELYQHKLDL